MTNVTAELSENSVVLPDGKQRRMLRWRPADTLRGRVLLLHGFGNHAGVFDYTGSVLSSAGFDTYAFDQRGFGDDRIKGRWPGGTRLLQDAVAVAGAVERMEPDVPVFLMGESLGAGLWIIAQARGLVHPAGLVLSGPACRHGAPHRWRDRIIVSALSMVIPRRGLKQPPDTSQFAPEAAEFFDSDPHILRFASVSDFAGILRIADLASGAIDAMTCPVWFGYGNVDEVIPLVSFEHAAKAMPPGAEVRPYQDGPHALLHWRNRELVHTDIVAWLNGQSNM